MWKFLGQGLNSSHSSDPSHYNGNARSLTQWATRKLLGITFTEKKSFIFRKYKFFFPRCYETKHASGLEQVDIQLRTAYWWKNNFCGALLRPQLLQSKEKPGSATELTLLPDPQWPILSAGPTFHFIALGLFSLKLYPDPRTLTHFLIAPLTPNLRWEIWLCIIFVSTFWKKKKITLLPQNSQDEIFRYFDVAPPHTHLFIFLTLIHSINIYWAATVI